MSVCGLCTLLLPMLPMAQAAVETSSRPPGDLPPAPLIVDVPISSLAWSDKAETVIERQVGVHRGGQVVPVRIRFLQDGDLPVRIGPPTLSCTCTLAVADAATLVRRGEERTQELGWSIPYQHGGTGLSARFPLQEGGRSHILDVRIHARSSDAVTAADWSRLLRMDDIRSGAGAGDASAGNSMEHAKTFRFLRGQWAREWDVVEVLAVEPSFLSARVRATEEGCELVVACTDAGRIPFLGYYTGSLTLGFRAQGRMLCTLRKGLSGRVTGPVRAVPATLYLGTMGGTAGSGADGGFAGTKDVVFDGFAAIERCQLDPLLARHLVYRICPVDEADRRPRVRFERIASPAGPIAAEAGYYFQPGIEVSGTTADGRAVTLRLMVVGNLGSPTG